jgi:hypothetical protein
MMHASLPLLHDGVSQPHRRRKLRIARRRTECEQGDEAADGE